MTTLKYRNPSINLKKREQATVKSLFKDFAEELSKFLEPKSYNDALNNIITEEIVKVLKRVTKKYNLDFNEVLTFALKSKITENTPKNLIDGIVDESVEEDIPIENDIKQDMNVYKQIKINNEKCYIKNDKIYTEDLKEIGNIIDGKYIMF
jgi:hypothetical protein